MVAGVPNDTLRGLREALPSEVAPGEVTSRQELAERVAAWVWERHGVEVPLDGKYVGKLERGQIEWPRTRVYREAFRAILGVATDRQLGFVRRRQSGAGSGTTGEVDRRSMIRGALAMGGVLAVGGSPAALLQGVQPAAVPASVGRDHVDQVRQAAETFDRMDMEHGGGMVREAATAQLRWSARLLDANYPAALRPGLFGAVAYLGYVCAFMAYDDGALDDADRLFGFALQCAEEAGDWPLRAIVLHGMASKECWFGDPDKALTYSDQALIRADRLTATQRAGMKGLRARALTAMGHSGESRAAIGQMDDEYARSTPGEAPPWLGFYTEAQHLGATGSHFYELVMAGDASARDQATTRIEAAIDGGQSARPASFSQVRLASLGLAGGDVEAGVVHAHRAIDRLGSIRSYRLRRMLADLDAYAAPHSRRSDVAEVRERLSPILTA